MLIYHNLVFFFRTQYDHGAQFHLKYNHNLNHKYKLAVYAHPVTINFYYIYYQDNFLYLTPLDMDEKWYGLIL